jgi:hypothetical protein
MGCGAICQRALAVSQLIPNVVCIVIARFVGRARTAVSPSTFAGADSGKDGDDAHHYQGSVRNAIKAPDESRRPILKFIRWSGRHPLRRILS